MAYPVVPPVERLGVHPVELSHPPGQGGIDRLDQQVVVIHHQAIRMTEPVEPFDRLFQYLEEPLPIRVIEKDILVRVTAGSDVIHRAWVFDSQWSCHDPIINHSMLDCKT